MASKGPPRFKLPIAAEKIKKGPAPPTEAILLESVTTSVPENLPVVSVGPMSPKPKGTGTGTGTGKGTRAPREAPVIDVGDVGDLPKNLVELEQRLLRKANESKIEVNKDDDVVFVPSDRRAFKHFIIQTYRRHELKNTSGELDPDACKHLVAASKSELKAFAYQAFVRDYIQKPSPYRGVLIYHGLGSGKTCTSIISFEALYQAGQRPVYVMTPASLSPNYKDDIINRCGPYVFRANNHWTFVSVPSLREPSAESALLIKRMGIPLSSVRSRKGAWVPDPSKKPNYTDLSPEHRKQVQAQIYEHLESRIEFIHYNGLSEATVRGWACDTPRMFDGATVIIDEVHNLVRTINNSSLEAFFVEEPRDMAQYTAKFCKIGKKYRISYLIYRVLCNAVGCKIIALSATPIINFPQELGILANLLAGDTRMVEVNSPGLDKRAEILRILKKHPEVDFVEVLPRPEINASTIRITPVPSGYRKVIEPMTGTLRGFVQDRRLLLAEGEMERERNLPAWFKRIQDSLAPVGLGSFGIPTFRSITRLPDVEKQFKDIFIDTERLEVKKSVLLPLMARLSGLISYYKGGKADYMARVTLDEVVVLDMSDLQLKKYTEQRKLEIDNEEKEKKRKKKSVKKMSLYELINKTQNSTFKIFSRACCNFVFPDDIERPIPSDYYDTLDMVGAKVPLIGETLRPDAEEEGKDAEEVIEEQLDDTEVVTDADIVEPEVKLPEEPVVPSAPVLDKKPYQTALMRAVQTLKSRAGELFIKPELEKLSPKFQALIDRLVTSRGPALVYSNFKTLEGVGLFGVALEAQLGYRKLDIIQHGGSWVLSPETLTSAGAPKYITYTGDEDRAKRNILLAIFNGKWSKIPVALATQVKELAGKDNNMDGSIAKVFMITQSGAEGISLANVRQVHIMEPYWNYVRLDQVKGRAIRICSHMDLPSEERTVDVFTYITKFSERQIKERLVDETIINMDDGQSTDETILNICNAKKQLADSILNTMQQAAVDCELMAVDNGTLACYRFAGTPSMEPLFHPLVDVHVNEAEAAVRSTVAP